MDNAIIHTYSPCSQLPLLFGLSDFIKGTSNLYHSTVRLGMDMYVDYSNHPISNFLDNKHKYPLQCNHEINYFNGWVDVEDIKKLLIKHNVIRIITNSDIEKGKITPDNVEFIKQSFNPNTRLLEYIDKLKQTIPPEYMGLQIRTGDLNNNCSKVQVEEAFKQIEKYIDTLDKSPLFVTSDNMYIKALLKKKYGFVYCIDNNPIHLGEVGTTPNIDKDLTRTRDTLADLFILLGSRGVGAFSIYSELGTGFTRIASKIFHIPITHTALLDWPYSLS